LFTFHDDFYAAVFYEHIIIANVIGHIHHIGESGAAAAFDTKPQSDAFATFFYVCSDLPGG
jgi:hypothetical protein